jgi:putative methionine-R-sulfoxide reductase with GAF domain
MTKDRKGAAPGSDAPGTDLRSERDQFLKNFTRGARLTEEFLREVELLQERLRELEAENAGLRAKVEADDAIRDLVAKIDRLESEKRELLSRFHRVEAVNSEFTARVQEVESEFANLANLFVASNQLHSSLSPRGVTRRIKEVLAQLVGAERYCMYLANQDGTELIPIAYEGVAGSALTPVKVADSELGRALRRGAAYVSDADPTAGSVERPAAIIPLSVDDKTVGVIAIFSTLSQKKRFDTVDFELFKLLGQHAAAALVSASLFAHTDRKLPGLEAFLDLSV